MKEKDLAKVVEDYLQLGENQDKWTWDRLNSGAAFVEGRKIRSCRAGTADYMVWKSFTTSHGSVGGYKIIRRHCILTFIELKGDKGKQRPSQKEFQARAEKHGAEYFIVKSLEQLQEILE